MSEQGYISEATYDQALADGLGLERGYRYETREQQYFFDFVQQELIDTLRRQHRARGRAQGLHDARPASCRPPPSRRSPTSTPRLGASAALVSTDTETGEILAMASSEAYEDSQFNLAAQGQRQPGSAFKPFVLTTAVDQGIDPDSTYYSAPSTITLTEDQYSSRGP